MSVKSPDPKLLEKFQRLDETSDSNIDCADYAPQAFKLPNYSGMREGFMRASGMVAQDPTVSLHTGKSNTFMVTCCWAAKESFQGGLRANICFVDSLTCTHMR